MQTPLPQPTTTGIDVQEGGLCVMAASTPMTRCHRMLKWAAEDLTDPAIAANPERLELERQTVIKRLSPHIEEIVQLAWAQLQQVQKSESSRSSP